MDFAVTIRNESKEQNYIYTIQFLDKIYVCDNNKVNASISNDDISSFLSAELTNPSPLTTFNQILNVRMQVLVFQRKPPANAKKGVDELDIMGFASIDHAQLLSSGQIVETKACVPLKTGIDLEITVMLSVKYNVANLEMY